MGKRTITTNGWLTLIGLISSIATIVQVIINLALQGKSNIDTIQTWITFGTVVTCIITLSVILVNAWIRNGKLNSLISIAKDDVDRVCADNRNKIATIKALAKYNHNINHQFRQMEFEIYNMLFSSIVNPEKEQATIASKFKGYLQNLTANVKGVFDVLTNDNSCSVYISGIKVKGYETESGEQTRLFVNTIYRDPTSYRERTNIDMITPDYNVADFTPFKTLMDRSLKCTSFACDDCSKFSNFRDRNHDWNKYYNACLCVPIRVRINKAKNEHQEIGFLTVDNQKGGFENENAINLLCSYADILYMSWSMFSDLNNVLTNRIAMTEAKNNSIAHN